MFYRDREDDEGIPSETEEDKRLMENKFKEMRGELLKLSVCLSVCLPVCLAASLWGPISIAKIVLALVTLEFIHHMYFV